MSKRRPKSKANAASGTPPRYAREFAAAWFVFYEVCEHRDCRRAKRCTGGAMPPCFAAFWPLVEEREKIRFRAILKARADGADVASAMAAGEADAARHDALLAQEKLRENANAPREAAPLAPVQSPPPAIARVAPPRIARVRQL